MSIVSCRLVSCVLQSNQLMHEEKNSHKCWLFGKCLNIVCRIRWMRAHCTPNTYTYTFAQFKSFGSMCCTLFPFFFYDFQLSSISSGARFLQHCFGIFLLFLSYVFFALLTFDSILLFSFFSHSPFERLAFYVNKIF